MEREDLTEKVVDVIEKIVPKVTEVTGTIEEVAGGVLNAVAALDMIKNKVQSIGTGKLVTVIYGDFENQKVLRGKIVSMTENGITVIDNDKTVKDPVLVQYKKIIDIFTVKKFKKEKEPFSMFKLNKAITEFFNGNEEELKHAYEQRITVKKLRDELRKKNKQK